MSFMDLLVLGLACARLSIMLSEDFGPWDIFEKLRHALGVRYDERSEAYGTTMLSRGIICPYCNSVWIGIALTILFVLAGDLSLILCLPLSLSMFAILSNLR